MIHYNERLPRTDTADTMTPEERLMLDHPIYARQRMIEAEYDRFLEASAPPTAEGVSPMTPAELRAYRLDVLGMTQATLAVALGVQPLSISRWELGRSPVPSWLRYALLGLAQARAVPA